MLEIKTLKRREKMRKTKHAGRPRTLGEGRQIGVRLTCEQIAWLDSHPCGRSAALRRIIQKAKNEK
jgi:hypothetical protein